MVATVEGLPRPRSAYGEPGRPRPAQPSVEITEDSVESDPATAAPRQRLDLRAEVPAPPQVHEADGSVGTVPETRSPVVGAAIVRDDQVLAARRTAPPEAAGRWEFPGGKVESDETPDAALVREIREELGCAVEVAGWLPGAVPIGARHVLTVALATLATGAEPEPREHDELRWLSAADLDDVDWLEPDRPFLPALRKHLGG